MIKRSVLMGDPTYFSIKHGNNPHTRNLWGVKKKVDIDLAITQWHCLAKLLMKYGIDVYVIKPDPNCPGLVYPANAGFLTHLDDRVPIQDKTFYLSNLMPGRKAEEPHYRNMLKGLGFKTEQFHKSMEGEADFFRWDNIYCFTYGEIEKQRIVFHFGFPPYRRVYGFRSDQRLEFQLKRIVEPHEVLLLKLVDEYHYHGDTVLSAFGPNREYLLVWMDGLERESQKKLILHNQNNIILLNDMDRQLYAANSFHLMFEDQYYLFLPEGVSDYLIAEIEKRNVTPILVNVSEFLKKGGGSIKCMLCDLGYLMDYEKKSNESILSFRKEHLYQAL